MFGKVLVANRGEIAIRIMRTLREMGIASIAVFSEADREAPFVRYADEAYFLGPAPASESYLNVPALLSIARQSSADAMHPGYGFLAENGDFAEAVEEAGMVFIGPTPHAIRLMGDKVRARQAVVKLGVPVVPGTDGAVESEEEAMSFADEHGYPVAVKAAGGGGGRGIQVVDSAGDLPAAIDRARRDAEKYFKSSNVYLERFFRNPRHVEIQVLADVHGNIVHLGERDCSVQRRHQKLIEEAPAPGLDVRSRAGMGEAAIRAARAAGYTSAGTVEFLVTQDGSYYFLEMNTRIQVEHPVTEAVAGVDLIKEMILIAAGEQMTVHESLLHPRGHAIEMRINAEDARNDFRPTPTRIDAYREPGGIGVRVDSGVEQGFTIPQNYDSLIAKLIVWAPDREAAIRRALRALSEFQINGPSTTIPVVSAILRQSSFCEGKVSTNWLGDVLPDLLSTISPADVLADVASEDEAPSQQREVRTYDVEVNNRYFAVRVAAPAEDVRPARTVTRPRKAGLDRMRNGPALQSPMHGTVIAIAVQAGDSVSEGQRVVVVEAMKMENEIHAHTGGTVQTVAVEVGDTVDDGQVLMEIT